jgi:hypothetical protein
LRASHAAYDAASRGRKLIGTALRGPSPSARLRDDTLVIDRERRLQLESHNRRLFSR